MLEEQFPNLQSHINFVIHAHQDRAKVPDNRVRGWDNETPYLIHPLWCATTILTETSLSRDLKIEGILVLLYYDVIEDTNAGVPNDLPLNVRLSIGHMTFVGGMRQEMNEIWEKEPKIRLYKPYNKVSNLLDSSWMQSDYQIKYRTYTYKLLLDVEKEFGLLNIVNIAHSIISPVKL